VIRERVGEDRKRTSVSDRHGRRTEELTTRRTQLHVACEILGVNTTVAAACAKPEVTYRQ
jgi:hypothetical protein